MKKDNAAKYSNCAGGESHTGNMGSVARAMKTMGLTICGWLIHW